MLQLHGINHADAVYCSDKICSALQLINFWQDLSIDLPNRRCYMPECWLKEANLSGQKLLDIDVHSEAFRPALLRAIKDTRQMLDDGAPLLCMIPFQLRLQIAATLHGGRCMLNKIEQSTDPLTERTSLNKSEWMRLILPILKDTLFPPGSNSHES